MTLVVTASRMTSSQPSGRSMITEEILIIYSILLYVNPHSLLRPRRRTNRLPRGFLVQYNTSTTGSQLYWALKKGTAQGYPGFSHPNSG